MSDIKEPENISDILTSLRKSAREGGEIPVADIMEGIGRSSYGPLLLLPGLFMATPGVSDIPGVPVILGIFIILISAQLIMGRKHFWMPQWFLDRKVSSKKLRKTAVCLHRPARAIDRHLVERLLPLVSPGGAKAIAICSILFSFATPVAELIPFSATGIGAAISAFGLALIARDGLTALIGWIITALTISLAYIAAF